MTKIQTKNRIFNLVEDEIHFGSENIRIFRWGNDLYFEDSSAGLHPLTELLGGGARVATVVVAQDGTGDVSDIQQGIDSLPSSGGLLWVREGTYEIDSGLFIQNKSSIELIFNKGVVIEHQEPSLRFEIWDGENIRISGLNWDGGSGEQPGRVKIWNVDNFSIDNSILRNSYEIGLLLQDCDVFNVERVLIEESYYDGICITASQGNIYSSTIRNVNQWGGTGAGIYLEDWAYRNRIWGNLIRDDNGLMDYGIWVRTDDPWDNGQNLILGNTIIGIPTPIHADPSDEVAHNVCV